MNGTGGIGGDAGTAGNASATATTSASGSFTTARATATGGHGGGGGGGGSAAVFGGTPGLAGESTAGGNAFASAAATNNGSVNVVAQATGGTGGSGGGGGLISPGVQGPGTNGSDGGSVSLGSVTGMSTGGGSVDVYGQLVGGRGGTGGMSGGNGGNGAAASLNNAVTGSTSGLLWLTQEATGGAGGDTGGGNGIPGTAGSATSTFTLIDLVASSLSGTSRAVGGDGGSSGVNGAQGSGQDGADATTQIALTGIGSVTVTAVGIGGRGGSAQGAGHLGGDGGVATTSGSGTSTMGGTVNVTVSNTGGRGSQVSSGGTAGGNGADALLINQTSGSTSGVLTLTQEATAGGGGSAVGEGTGGNGGVALSSLMTTNHGGRFDGRVTAIGGDGGGGTGSATPGNGGGATAFIDLTNGNDILFAVANATGGFASTNSSAGLTGIRGLGNATAIATTPSGHLAWARTSATGRVANATSQSNTSGGAVSSISVIANATDHQSLTTESMAVIGGGFSGTVTGFRAMGWTVGLPSTSGVAVVLFGNPNVTAAYNPPDGNHTALAVTALGVSTPNTVPGATPTLSVTADYSFDLSMLTGGKLMIGLVDPESAGPGFTSLHFTVEREDAFVEDQTFATVAAAMSYFDDHVLDLGPMVTGVVGTLDLSISLEMISPDNNTRFGTRLLIADVGPALLPGDYNDDGTVDAADYVVWRKYEGTMNTLPNDPTGGTIGAAQFNLWRANFGNTLAGSGSARSTTENLTNVPEPASGLLILAALTFCPPLLRKAKRFVGHNPFSRAPDSESEIDCS